MSFKIPEGLKRGDTVEILLRGEVTEVGSRGDWFELDGEFSFDQDNAAALVVSVEKVKPPLPTTPGSVILSPRTQVTYMLGRDGKWWSPGSIALGSRGALDLSAPGQELFDIIFVADDAS